MKLTTQCWKLPMVKGRKHYIIFTMDIQRRDVQQSHDINRCNINYPKDDDLCYTPWVVTYVSHLVSDTAKVVIHQCVHLVTTRSPSVAPQIASYMPLCNDTTYFQLFLAQQMKAVISILHVRLLCTVSSYCNIQGDQLYSSLYSGCLVL